jgi:hypothetical protein
VIFDLADDQSLTVSHDSQVSAIFAFELFVVNEKNWLRASPLDLVAPAISN